MACLTPHPTIIHTFFVFVDHHNPFIKERSVQLLIGAKPLRKIKIWLNKNGFLFFIQKVKVEARDDFHHLEAKFTAIMENRMEPLVILKLFVAVLAVASLGGGNTTHRMLFMANQTGAWQRTLVT